MLICVVQPRLQGEDSPQNQEEVLYKDSDVLKLSGREILRIGSIEKVLRENRVLVNVDALKDIQQPDLIIGLLGLNKNRVKLLESMVVNGYSAERYKLSNKYDLVVLARVTPKEKGRIQIEDLEASIVPSINEKYIHILLDVRKRKKVQFSVDVRQGQSRLTSIDRVSGADPK